MFTKFSSIKFIFSIGTEQSTLCGSPAWRTTRKQNAKWFLGLACLDRRKARGSHARTNCVLIGVLLFYLNETW